MQGLWNEVLRFLTAFCTGNKDNQNKLFELLLDENSLYPIMNHLLDDKKGMHPGLEMPRFMAALFENNALLCDKASTNSSRDS